MGNIHALQSFGAADGPGVRYVVFLQGCPLRCSCCHNPDSWPLAGGFQKTPQEIFAEVIKYKEYFGALGGLTLSGGEPLLQPAFCLALFTLCKDAGITTCLDTSGCLQTPATAAVLAVTDTILLDLKYTNETDYRRYVGCSLGSVLDFLKTLQQPVWLRQVIIPGINDTVENVEKLATIARSNPHVQRVELLPFKTLCQEKYDRLGIPFPFGHLPSPSAAQMEALRAGLLPTNNLHGG